MKNFFCLCFFLSFSVETSTQLLSFFSKTGFLWKFLKVRLNSSTNTAPKRVFLGQFFLLLLFKRLVKYLLTNSDPSSLPSKLLFFAWYENLLKGVPYGCSNFFQRNCPTKFAEFINHNQRYLQPLFFFEHKPLNLISSNSKYHKYDTQKFCLW